MNLKDGHAAAGTGPRSTFQQELWSKVEHVKSGCYQVAFHQQSKELMSDSSSRDGAMWRSGRSFRRAGLCGPIRRHLGSTRLPVPPLMSLFLSDRELALTVS